MKSLLILISGRGSNMLRIAQCCRDEGWDAQISCVISNRPDAAGLASAQALGLATEVVNHKDFADRAEFDQALAARIDHYQPDLLVLAGFMRILTPQFVARYRNRLINIHPSLLPAYPGLHTHRRALADGVKVHGATVHFVTQDLDAGPIIAQAIVAVGDSDDESALMARVQTAEHTLYPAAVKWFVEGRLSVLGDVTRLADSRLGEALLITGQGDQ